MSMRLYHREKDESIVQIVKFDQISEKVREERRLQLRISLVFSSPQDDCVPCKHFLVKQRCVRFLVEISLRALRQIEPRVAHHQAICGTALSLDLSPRLV